MPAELTPSCRVCRRGSSSSCAGQRLIDCEHASALQASLTALRAHEFAQAAVWLLPAIAGWWFTAGIGIRLGVVPRDFLVWLDAVLGFALDPRRRDSD